MRLKIIVVSLLVVGSLYFCRGVALSQGGSSIPADCKNKDRMQYLSSGSFIGNGTTKVKCTVDYWICGTRSSKSQIVDNVVGACDRFKDSVVSGLPREACCDCYPNCNSAQKSDQSGEKKDCCDQVQQLQDQNKQLEARVRQLEEKLNGDDITLANGASNIRISNMDRENGVSINSDGPVTISSGGQRITLTGSSISITSTGAVGVKAAGVVSIKGSRVTQN